MLDSCLLGSSLWLKDINQLEKMVVERSIATKLVKHVLI